MDQRLLQKWAENQAILPFDQKIVTTEFPKRPKPQGTAVYSADMEDGNLLKVTHKQKNSDSFDP